MRDHLGSLAQVLVSILAKLNHGAEDADKLAEVRLIVLDALKVHAKHSTEVFEAMKRGLLELTTATAASDTAQTTKANTVLETPSGGGNLMELSLILRKGERKRTQGCLPT